MPLLRKYIEYARKYLRPSLSLEAEAVIKECVRFSLHFWRRAL
jgi:DNA replicative helicase MCM subunit Mcm2 (Cdc46/Mcm family)